MSDFASIILVKPQLSSNIGAVARAMYNFSCTDLRLVMPKDNWNDDHAKAVATGAYFVLDQAKVFSNLNDAVVDLHSLFALTARKRYLNKPFLDLKEIDCSANINNKVGLIFGPENSGLSNEDLVLANKLITISTNPDFSSLNLAQSVAITLHQLSNTNIERVDNPKASSKANRGELISFLDQLENAIEQTNFIQVEEKRIKMLHNIKNIFTRIEDLTSQEIQTLRGIITSLTRK